MKKLILIGTIGILALTSCSKEELTSNGLPANLTCEQAKVNYDKEIKASKTYEEWTRIREKYKTAYPKCNF
jgi:hypothetical protein